VIKKTRRVVTGHNEAGKSCIAIDETCPKLTKLWHEDFTIEDVWRSHELPADNLDQCDPCEGTSELEPAPNGNVVRIVNFPPDADYIDDMDAASGFRALGESGAASMQQDESAPHPLMHQTNTVDYIIVISGEIYAVLESGEALLREGDVLVQRGTNHAWSNRSNKICKIVAILNGAKPL